MDVTFTNSKLAKLCNSAAKLRGKYGPVQARLIQQRLGELQAADNLEVTRKLPGGYHELLHNLKGLLAVSVGGKERLAFEPDHDPVPQLPSGGLDWSSVTKVVVVGIGDYH